MYKPTSRCWYLCPRSMIAILCSIVLVSSAGCTTTRTVNPQNQSAMAGLLEAGDLVKAKLHDGREVELTFIEETPDHIVGRDRADAVLTIDRGDIAYLEVKQTSIVKTVLLVGGILTVVAAVGIASAYGELLGDGSVY